MQHRAPVSSARRCGAPRVLPAPAPPCVGRVDGDGDGDLDVDVEAAVVATIVTVVTVATVDTVATVATVARPADGSC